jgi:hypothetical protein
MPMGVGPTIILMIPGFQGRTTKRGRPPVAPTELSPVGIIRHDNEFVGMSRRGVRPNPGRRIGLPLRDAAKPLGKRVGGRHDGLKS